MTAKKYFSIFLRVFFIFFSLQYLKEAFYKWDGYSFYLRFSEILPDFSLAYILWSIFGAIFALIFCFIIYLSYKVLFRVNKNIRQEHIIVWLIVAAILLFIKRAYEISTTNIGELIGIDRFFIWLVGGVLITAFVWFGRIFIERYTEKILSKINSILAPLVLIFTLV